KVIFSVICTSIIEMFHRCLVSRSINYSRNLAQSSRLFCKLFARYFAQDPTNYLSISESINQHPLFYRYAFCKVTGLVYICAAPNSNVISEKLQGHDSNDRAEQCRRFRDIQDIIGFGSDQYVALGRNGDDNATTRFGLLDLANHFLVKRVAKGDAQNG